MAATTVAAGNPRGLDPLDVWQLQEIVNDLRTAVEVFEHERAIRDLAADYTGLRHAANQLAKTAAAVSGTVARTFLEPKGAA